MSVDPQPFLSNQKERVRGGRGKNCTKEPRKASREKGSNRAPQKKEGKVEYRKTQPLVEIPGGEHGYMTNSKSGKQNHGKNKKL